MKTFQFPKEAGRSKLEGGLDMWHMEELEKIVEVARLFKKDRYSRVLLPEGVLPPPPLLPWRWVKFRKVQMLAFPTPRGSWGVIVAWPE